MLTATDKKRIGKLEWIENQQVISISEYFRFYFNAFLSPAVSFKARTKRRN